MAFETRKKGGGGGVAWTEYADADAFPSSDNTVGDYAFALADTSDKPDGLYRWDGTAWKSSGLDVKLDTTSLATKSELNNLTADKVKVFKNRGLLTDPNFDSTFAGFQPSGYTKNAPFNGSRLEADGYMGFSSASSRIGTVNPDFYITFTTGINFVSYSVTCGADPTTAPRSWKLVGHTSTSTPTTSIDEQTDVSWSANETKTFVLDTTAFPYGANALRRVGFDTTALQSPNPNNDLRVVNLELFEDDGTVADKI